MTARVLLVGEIGGPLEALLRERSYDVAAVGALDDAAAELRRSWVDVIVLDVDEVGAAAPAISALAEGLGNVPPHVALSARGGGGTIPKGDRPAVLDAVAAALPERPRSASDQIRSSGATFRRAASRVRRLRIVVCGSPARVSALGRAALRVAAFQPPAEPAPLVPVPHTAATMTLGPGFDLELVALPLVPAYAPLWPLALAGAHAVVRLDAAAAKLLDEACAWTDRRHMDAAELVPGFAEDDEDKLAEIVRAAVDKADVA